MKFSVLIPAYKSSFLKDALDSILMQTYANFEVVIVDDCSPEPIKSIVDGYSDSRIHYYRNPKNYGALNVVDNWNTCLSYAVGDYVICMGDDDMLAPTCLENYVKIIEKYPGLDVYHTRTMLINEQSEIVGIQEYRPEYETAFSLWWYRWNGRDWQYIGDFLYNRLSLLSLGGFYKLPMAWASDDISAVRAALPHGIANISIPGFYYRQNSETISNSATDRIKADATILEEAWYSSLLEQITPQTEMDKLFVRLISTNMYEHFCERFWIHFYNDMRLNPFHVFYWYRKKRNYHLSNKKIVLCFLASLLKKMLKSPCSTNI